MDNKIQEIRHAEEANGNFDRSWREEQWGEKKLSVAAHDFTRDEKEMTIREAIVANKKAIFWSLVISTCVIMEGYDTNLLGNFYAYRKVQQPIWQELKLIIMVQHPFKESMAIKWLLPSKRQQDIR